MFKKEEEVKRLEAIQIEVCSSCNINCIFCPITYKHDSGKDTMEIELFKKLVPYFSRSNWVYLQGWGEPLLHKDFWQMVQLAKRTGVKVGFTSNGVLLNQDAIILVFATGVDHISISIAGASEEVHGKLRFGSTLEHIGDNIRMLLKERQAKRLASPKVSISYMLTKDSILELPEALKLAINWGVDDFYTTHLDYVFDQQADSQRIFYLKDKEQEDFKEIEAEVRQYQEYLNAAILLSIENRFSFRYNKLVITKEQEAACELNPSRFLFITANGDVTPCTYLGRGENSKIFCGKSVSYPCYSFGSIKDLEFGQILENERYRKFSKPFEKREEAMAQLMTVYTDYEPSLIIIQTAEEKYRNIMENYPLPTPCQVCPKSFGV